MINDDHECRILSHSEQVDAYIRSERRWNDKRRRDKDYKYFEHMSWIDIHNQGVLHFGIHPDDLPRDSIRFDVFHLRCAITRRLMNSLRKFMMTQTVEMIQEFGELILGKFWSDYNIL